MVGGAVESPELCGRFRKTLDSTMARPSSVPKYRKLKQSGQAIATFRLPGGKRKDYLLGDYNSKESWAEYHRLIGEWQAGHSSFPGSSGPGNDLTINELLVRYMRFCEGYYRSAEGTPTGQAGGTLYA